MHKKCIHLANFFFLLHFITIKMTHHKRSHHKRSHHKRSHHKRSHRKLHRSRRVRKGGMVGYMSGAKHTPSPSTKPTGSP